MLSKGRLAVVLCVSLPSSLLCVEELFSRRHSFGFCLRCARALFAHVRLAWRGATAFIAPFVLVARGRCRIHVVKRRLDQAHKERVRARGGRAS